MPWAVTDCRGEQVAAFILRLYFTGAKDPKWLTLKGLQGRRGPDVRSSCDLTVRDANFSQSLADNLHSAPIC